MKDFEPLFRFFEKIQYNFGEAAEENMKLLDYQTFDFFPDMAMFSVSYKVKKTFQRNSTTPRSFDDAICFYFKNVAQNKNRVSDLKNYVIPPVVHILPFSATRISTFKKDEQVQVLCIIIRTPFLQRILGQDAEKFSFLYDQYQNFLVEEFLTDDMVRSVTDILHTKLPETLTEFHYRILALKLLFHLFKSLGNRSQIQFHKLSNQDITAIYNVRDALIADLSQAVTVEELSKIAGMNVSKMRKLFIQIFGMGIYNYFQKQRMMEAARLLKEQKLSVSEVGYALGFENMSHFTRVFEQQIGQKPKAYSRGMILELLIN